jgi:hypothetical protein
MMLTCILLKICTLSSTVCTCTRRTTYNLAHDKASECEVQGGEGTTFAKAVLLMRICCTLEDYMYLGGGQWTGRGAPVEKTIGYNASQGSAAHWLVPTYAHRTPISYRAGAPSIRATFALQIFNCCYTSHHTQCPASQPHLRTTL